MSYKVKVAEWVAEFLRSLPRNVQTHVFERLFVELPSDPNGQLGEQIVPFAHKFTFQVSGIDSSQNPPLGYWYVFVVDRGTPGELHIESVREGYKPNLNGQIG